MLSRVVTRCVECRGAFYFHILTTIHGQNYIKFDLNCLDPGNVHLNNLNAPVLNVLSSFFIKYGCNLCILLEEAMYSYRCLCVVYVFLEAATLTEVFPCFFLSCKANARV